VLLTFDDASAGQYTRALPLLRRHHFVATFFVMTVVLDKPGWLTSRQVRQLDRDGMTIAPHTYDHHAVPQYRGEDWHTQLVAPAAKLEKLVGHPVRLFAYPFGLWSPEAFAHLDDAGYVAAFQLAGKLDRRHPCGRCGASSCRSSPAASCWRRSSATSEESGAAAPGGGARRVQQPMWRIGSQTPPSRMMICVVPAGTEVVVGTGIGDGAGAAAPASEGTISAAVTAAIGTARAARRRRERDWESTSTVLPVGGRRQRLGSRAGGPATVRVNAGHPYPPLGSKLPGLAF
jgi:hypothetical protein